MQVEHERVPVILTPVGDRRIGNQETITKLGSRDSRGDADRAFFVGLGDIGDRV